MTKLQSLFAEFGQSPWLDNLSRPYLQDGTLRRLVGDGIRGVTANPTILARAIEGTAAYDEQFAALVRSGLAVPDAYWELVVDDIAGALAVLRPVFDDSEGTDGFVSVEVAPELAHDTVGTVAADVCAAGATGVGLGAGIAAAGEAGRSQREFRELPGNRSGERRVEARGSRPVSPG